MRRSSQMAPLQRGLAFAKQMTGGFLQCVLVGTAFLTVAAVESLRRGCAALKASPLCQRGGGICEANDGGDVTGFSAVLIATFKIPSVALESDSSPWISKGSLFSLRRSAQSLPYRGAFGVIVLQKTTP